MKRDKPSSHKDHAWLKDKFGELIRRSKELAEINPLVFYPGHTWTALKLLFLPLWVGVYSSIIGKRYDNMFYIDLFAGPGIDLIQESKVKIAGSPILANVFARSPFTKSICCEIKAESRIALASRLEVILPQDKFQILGDVNENISAITNIIDGVNCHYFSFVDPQGLELDWSTLEKLLHHKGDVVILYNTREVWRVRKAALAEGQTGQAKRLDLFFGDTKWRDKDDENKLMEYYLAKVCQSGPDYVRRQVSRFISIELMREDIHYHLLFATRMTKGGSEWIQAIDHIKQRLESFGPKAVNIALEIAAGKLQRLDEFFGAKKKDDFTLEDFFQNTKKDGKRAD